MNNRKKNPKIACTSVQKFAAISLCLLASPLAFAQSVNPDTAPDTFTGADDTITLSPFTVDASTEKGYFAQNTLAGSRLNTNITDLASAISVVTKQQLEDTGSLDINDVFRYEISTEGSTTYTPTTTSMRGDGVADAVGGASFGNSTTVSTNATANRIRGLGSPTRALNYYPAISSVPFDSYNTQSVEISRGPNSMLFGMGSPAGIVNQSTSTADVTKDSAQFELRFDNRGSKRAVVSFNKKLIKNKLAIYGAVLHNDQGFERKPSYDTTRRQYGTLTFKPFKGTKITATIEHYDNHNRRPNSLTPVDYVSEWKDAGMPVYDGNSKHINYLGTGAISATPYLLSANDPQAQSVVDWLKAQPSYTSSLLKDTTNSSGIRTVTYGGVNIFSTSALVNKYITANGRTETPNPFYVPGITTTNSRAIQSISNGQLVNYEQPLAGVNPTYTWGANSAGRLLMLGTSNVTAANYAYSNPEWASNFQRLPTRSANYSAPDSFVMGSYRYSGVTDKSIYDWENINISQANFGSASNTNANVELEQEIIPGLLTFSGGWFRQTYSSLSTYTIAQLNATALMVDTNMYNMDGSPNQNLGQVFVEDVDPDRYRNDEEVDNYRAMLAFTPDFTKNKGWTKWLGRHQFLGLYSYMDNAKTAYRERLTYVDAGSDQGKYYFLPNPLPTAAGAETGWRYPTGTVRRYYYLSSPGDAYGAVTQSSGTWDQADGNFNVSIYDYQNSTFRDTPVKLGWEVHDAGTQINERTLESLSAGWTGYFWKDRLITTVGVRRDVNRTRSTTNGATSDAPTMTNAEKWVDGVYQYNTVFERWNDWSEVTGTTSTMGAVFKPFSKWHGISQKAAEGNLFWMFLENFGVSANSSNNFDAPTTTNVDLFGNVLPKPEGEGKDYGIQFSLGKKFFARLNSFTATNENMVLGGTAKTAMDRLSDHIDTNTYRSWLETLYIINQGYDPTVTDWRKAFDADAAQVATMQKVVGEDWWGLGDWNYYANRGGVSGATAKAKASGTEVEINFNPLPNWTLRFTGSKVNTRYTNTLNEFDAWSAVRNPIWTGAKASQFLKPEYAQYANGYTDAGGRAVKLDTFWESTNFNSTIRSDSANGWYTPKEYYDAVVTPQYALARDLEGTQVQGQRQYNASLVTTYNFTSGKLKGWAIGGGQRWSDKAILGYYGRASGGDANYPNKLDISDTSRPIYDDAVWYTDLWMSYSTKILSGKAKLTVRLNVSDVFQGGELKPVAVNFDGSYSSYRIIDPRTFTLTTKISF